MHHIWHFLVNYILLSGYLISKCYITINIITVFLTRKQNLSLFKHLDNNLFYKPHTGRFYGLKNQLTKNM